MARVSSFMERFAELLERSSRPDVAIAEALGVSKQTISAWKTGVRSPKNPMIIKIADLFGVDVAWLMGFEAELEKVSDTFRRNANTLFSALEPADIKSAIDNGADISLVRRVIEGTGPVTLDTAHQVASTLGVTVGDLLDEESRPASASDPASEFVVLFENLTPDMKAATLAAMKAFLSTQESNFAGQGKA